MTFKLRQWKVSIGSKRVERIFAPVDTERSVVIGMAVAAFGDEIGEIVDEGTFVQVVPERLR